MTLINNEKESEYPECATSRIQRAAFRDIDEQAAQLAGHDQVYLQLSRGRFHGRFLTVELGCGATLYIEETNQSLVQYGCVPVGQVSFMFLLGDADWCRFQGGDFTPSDLAVMPALSTFSVRCPADTSFCVVTVDNGVLGDSSWLDPRLTGAFRLQSRQLSTMVGALRLIVRTSLSILEGIDDPVRYALTRERLRQSLLSTIGLALSAHASHASQAASAVPGLLAGADDLIRENLREIDVSKLCRILGVPRRTLDSTFQRELGIGPSGYIKALRLNQIRREISRASPSATIADIAASWGLWHPSHFTQSYASMFGERPSETRLGAAVPQDQSPFSATAISGNYTGPPK